MFNDVTLVGNAVSQPEIKYTPAGKPVAKFNIAVNKHYKDPQTGEAKQQTMFIEVVAFGVTAENTHKYVYKGMRVLVNGELHQDVWVDSTGQKRSKHNIHASKVVFLQCKNGSSSNGVANTQAPQHSYQQQTAQPKPAPQPEPKPDYQSDIEDLPDEDIPF